MRYWLTMVNFNSIKVQLELLKRKLSKFIGFYFNSIKVQLELIAPTSANGFISIFQFHKGTIRTHHLVS